jgi:hypothetical protein
MTGEQGPLKRKRRDDMRLAGISSEDLEVAGGKSTAHEIFSRRSIPIRLTGGRGLIRENRFHVYQIV